MFFFCMTNEPKSISIFVQTYLCSAQLVRVSLKSVEPFIFTVFKTSFFATPVIGILPSK
jgi:hypothetical protein